MTGKRGRYYLIRAIPALMLLVLLFLLPLSFSFHRSFSDGFGSLLGIFRDGYTYRLLSFTLKQSLLSAFISVLAAIPFAAFISTYSFPGRKAILTLASLSFTLPAILVVLGFVIWYGNNGILNRALMQILSMDEPPLRILYSFSAVILAHVYLNFPVALSLLTASWTSMPDAEEKASYLMGSGHLRTFFRITLPKLRGSLIAAFMLIFLFCFSSFTIVMVLGGKPEFSTLESEIYRRLHTEGNVNGAASISVFVIIVNSVMLIATSGARRSTRKSRKERELKRARGMRLLQAFLISLIILLFLLPPLLAIAYRSFYTKEGTFTLSAWKSVFRGGKGLLGSAPKAILSSFLIAIVSAFVSVMLAERLSLYSAKSGSHLVPFLATLPMATGSVTLGMGFLLVSSFIHSSSSAVSYMLVIAAHLIITIPFAVRTILPGARSISDSIALSSLTLGASMKKTIRKAERPLLSPYIRKAFAFSFAISLGEVNATLTLSEGSVSTIPVLMYRMIDTYNYQGASALGIILLTEALIVFAICECGGKHNAIS